MKGYLWALLAHGAGVPSPVSLRPKTRFEEEGGGFTLIEEPLLLDPSPADARKATEVPPDATSRAPVTEVAPALRARSHDELFTQPTKAIDVHHETVHFNSETHHHEDRSVERRERILERHYEAQPQPPTAGAATAVQPAAPLAAVEVHIASHQPDAVAPTPGPMPLQARSQAPIPSHPIQVRSEPQRPRTIAESPARSPAAPDITVSIGRLDIRLTPTNEARPQRKQAPSAPTESALSLTEYLQGRARSAR